MIECVNFKSYQKGFMQGFADIYVDRWGIFIFGIPLYSKNGKRWVGLPGKEFEGKNGCKGFNPCIKFKETTHKKAFCKQTKKAIDKWCLDNNNEKGK